MLVVRQLERRTFAKGIAWSVPVVVAASAAPAVAASCAAVTIDWDTTTLSGGAVTVGTTTMRVTRAGSGSGTANDLTVRSGPMGGVNERFLQLERATPAKTTSATYTFTFSQPVSNLTFSVYDIDATIGSGWIDGVSFSSGFSATSTGATLTGTGTAASPFQPSQPATTGNLSGSDARGNVTVSYAGPLTSFTITYTNVYTGTNSVSGNQGIGVSDLTFTPSSC